MILISRTGFVRTTSVLPKAVGKRGPAGSDRAGDNNYERPVMATHGFLFDELSSKPARQVRGIIDSAPLSAYSRYAHGPDRGGRWRESPAKRVGHEGFEPSTLGLRVPLS